MCNHNNKIIIKTGSHKGLYCKDCGKWLKWLGKQEYRKYIFEGVKEK